MRLKGDCRSWTKWIEVGNISPHPRIQRPFDEAWAHKLAKIFDANSFDPLNVVQHPKKDDHFYVFCGQHRRAAAEEKFGPRFEVPCQVYDRNTPEEVLAKIQHDKSTPKTWRAFWAFMLKARAKDPTVLDIVSVVEGAGLSLSESSSDGCVSAVKALRSTYSRIGRQGLMRVISLLKSSWGGDADAYQSHLIRGVGILVHKYNGDMNDTAMVQTMKRQTNEPIGFIGKARMLASNKGISTSAAVAELLHTEYNKRKSAGKLPPL